MSAGIGTSAQFPAANPVADYNLNVREDSVAKDKSPKKETKKPKKNK